MTSREISNLKKLKSLPSGVKIIANVLWDPGCVVHVHLLPCGGVINRPTYCYTVCPRKYIKVIKGHLSSF